MVNLEKIKSHDDVKQREIFTSLEDGFNYFSHIHGLFAADSAPDVDYLIFGHTVNADGEVVADESKPWPVGADGAPYPSMVAVLSKQREVDGKNKQVPSVIVLHPIPSVSQLMLTDEGSAMVNAVIAKELNHRAFRPLRSTENHESASGEMPADIAAYCTSGREAGGSSTLAVFNDLFGGINKYLKDNVPAFKVARVTKDHLRKSLENSAFAAHYYPTLESAGLFAKIGEMFIKLGNKQEMDVSIVETWLTTRESQTYAASDSNEGLDGLDDLLDGLGSDAVEAQVAAE